MPNLVDLALKSLKSANADQIYNKNIYSLPYNAVNVLYPYTLQIMGIKK